MVHAPSLQETLRSALEQTPRHAPASGDRLAAVLAPLVETPEPNLSAGMHQLNGPYARLFNTRHGRVGALFQSRFHATVVETEEHLETAAHYIAANPVRAGLCAHPDDWPWSWF